MIYDLSYVITNDLPVYPGDPQVSIMPAGRLEKDGFNDVLLTMGTHNGTHIDAAAHMLDGGKQLKDYPIERFVVPAVCIDARQGFSVEALSNVQAGTAVIFYTGASDYFTEEKYWHDYPVLNQAMIEALIEMQVSMIGIDTGSFDNQDDFPVHKQLLGNDMLLIENLTNLEPLVGKTFELTALPLKLEQDGAPARVIARL